MAINTRSIQDMIQEQRNDEATSWTQVAHWSTKLSENVTKHLLISGRTIVREYTVTWTDGVPTVCDMPAEYTTVGEVVGASALKTVGFKRHKGTSMFNSVTREMFANI